MVKPVKRKVSHAPLSLKFSEVIRNILLRSLPYTLSLTMLGIFFGAVGALAVNSPIFELKSVKILNMGTLTSEQAFKFSELQPGENLIHLDLVNVQQVIKRNHPEFKEVRVRRVLPNRVEIFLKRRTPAAQVFFSSYVQIDKDLVLLPGSSQTPFRNLMVIKGAERPRSGLYVGATLNDSDAQKALWLMEIIKRSGILKKRTLTQIDIGDPKNFSLIVDGNIEIKMGNNHFIERIKILDQTLKTLNVDVAKVRYIDLRFDDVVIGTR